MKTLDNLGDLHGKTVFLRLDLNVPVNDAKLVTDKTRISRAKDTVLSLLGKGARVMVGSHFGRPKGLVMPEYSLDFLPRFLSSEWGVPVHFVRDCIGTDVVSELDELPDGAVLLLENLRFYVGEEANDPDFARMLAMPADIIVNDAFSVSHRAHASVTRVMDHKPGYAGYLLGAEIAALKAALTHPDRPVAAIIGGSKISTKLSLLHHMVEKVDHLILGGGMANTFIAAQGVSLGRSLVEADMSEEALAITDKATAHGCTIHLPIDGVCARELAHDCETQILGFDDFPGDLMVLDAGPKTVEALIPVINTCQTLIWNGPMGAFEFPPFDAATNALASHVATRTQSGKLTSIAGGGDTVAALNGSGQAENFTYLSTAGGAFLEWMEGKTLPGVKALG